MIRFAVLVMLAAACGVDNDRPADPTPQAAPAAKSPRLPDNDRPATPTPQAAPAAKSPRLPCTAEIAILCPDGYQVGCGDLTTDIVCVRKGLKAVAPCATEIVMPCPEGEIDSCSASPPYGDKHICVKP